MCNMYNLRKHHQDRVVANRMKQLRYIFIYSPFNSEEKQKKDKARARKTKPWDCGNPGCPTCSNPRRVWKRITNKEILSYKKEKEMMDEYFDDVA